MSVATGISEADVAAAWAELAELYRELDRRLTDLVGDCGRCSGCCRFLDRFVLYTSKLERSYLEANAPRPAPEKFGEAECPYLDDNVCLAREWRCLGCRIYFCQPEGEEPRRELYEEFHRRIGAITERRGFDWDYAPLLARLATEIG